MNSSPTCVVSVAGVRFSILAPVHFEKILQKLSSVFPCSTFKKWKLTYSDDEGDAITISTEEELQEAFSQLAGSEAVVLQVSASYTGSPCDLKDIRETESFLSNEFSSLSSVHSDNEDEEDDDDDEDDEDEEDDDEPEEAESVVDDSSSSSSSSSSAVVEEEKVQQEEAAVAQRSISVSGADLKDLPVPSDELKSQIAKALQFGRIQRDGDVAYLDVYCPSLSDNIERVVEVPAVVSCPFLKNGAVSHSAFCDHCQAKIQGVRFKCFACPDYDLCAECEPRAHLVHFPDHPFIKISNLSQTAVVYKSVLFSGKKESQDPKTGEILRAIEDRLNRIENKINTSHSSQEAAADLEKQKEQELASIIKEREATLRSLEKQNLLRIEEEARLRAEYKKKAEEEEARVKAEQLAKLAKLKAEEQEARIRAEKLAKLEEVRIAYLKKKAEEQEARIKAEQEAEEARIKAEQEARIKAEREAEEARVKAEQLRLAKLKAEQEALKHKLEEEARALAKALKQKAEEEARIKAEQEARAKALEAARIKAEEEEKLRHQQLAKLLEEARKIEEDKRRQFAEESRAKVEALRREAESQARLERLKLAYKDQFATLKSFGLEFPDLQILEVCEAKKGDLQAVANHFFP